MYRVDRNDFYRTVKRSTVYTPPLVSEFIYNVVHKHIPCEGCVLDPCVWAGSLLEPFRKGGFKTQGIDIEYQGCPETLVRNFLTVSPGEIETPALVVANPPFNVDRKTVDLCPEIYGRRPLLPEVWLQKCLSLWDKSIPIVLFAPYGLRLNQTLESLRWRRFVTHEYPEIKSLIALPKDVYDGVLFHSEILIFNINGLKSHYFFHG